MAPPGIKGLPLGDGGFILPFDAVERIAERDDAILYAATLTGGGGDRVTFPVIDTGDSLIVPPNWYNVPVPFTPGDVGRIRWVVWGTGGPVVWLDGWPYPSPRLAGQE